MEPGQQRLHVEGLRLLRHDLLQAPILPLELKAQLYMAQLGPSCLALQLWRVRALSLEPLHVHDSCLDPKHRQHAHNPPVVKRAPLQLMSSLPEYQELAGMEAEQGSYRIGSGCLKAQG